MKLTHLSFALLVFISLYKLICADEKKDTPLPLAQAVEEVYPAIVRIEVVSEQGSSGRMMKSRATGSGVIVSADGRVVTNHHVAGKATRITCRLHDGEEVMADLLGADPMTDLAVLRLRMEDRPPTSKPLTVATFGNSDEVEIGDVCFAMGSPAGLSQSVTRGIVSNVALISPNQGSFRLDGENVGELVRWLGHDAIIFPGNSGGPLVDEKGFIIGINEVGIGSLGGAIPSNLARSVSKELAENGFISRCWTGLEC
ncbi:MAG: trypsin-like serine protease, partial [Opitutae bacterium]|nr:trypsin-like serine protease [Opitutae bacterium]